jgi:hypothetical protein
MKLEYLADGSSECPLIRWYDFNSADAQRLREACRSLAYGSQQVLPLHEEWWIEPVEGCQLTLRTGPRDLGIVQRLPMRFDCVLSAETWRAMADLAASFCESADGAEPQWLTRHGEISLLLSPSGNS